MTKSVGIVDTILRDAHQSLIATRMTTEQMIPVLENLDNAGYHALEVWGGATFDACIRYLNEDPWERLRTIRKHVKHTKLQMLLRGQNLLGYKHYPDDIVDAFIQKSIENGIDIVRCFDALNDIRNLKQAVKSVKKYGGHAQLAICYTISDVHTDAYYFDLVKEMVELGADSIAIKDMAGILTPHRAESIVKGIKKITTIPLEVHTHATSGISEMTYLKAIEAGADIIDTAVSAFSGGTSQPATESMILALREMGYDIAVDLDEVQIIRDHFLKVKETFVESGDLNIQVYAIDPNTLITQVPGGMISNLLSQLKEAKQLDKFQDVLNEVPRVRKELGYPPLVTPLSQMVGTQAVMNILSNARYKLVPNEIKEYMRGYYGKPPAPIDENIIHQVLGDDQEIISVRPADLLQPELEQCKETLKEIATSLEDVLSYALFPQLVLPYLKKKHDPFYDVIVQDVTVIL
ncbi:oxaloacetate decarboxylase [Erysipelothrix larvae]|uniref:Oxaloacetate decarboxylase n=1 Tax=Erysipelothrix larvae TaxID=1514105 RepID=A0A0X8H172_9FIRM|nr:oxaloacetate decarboxylase subunit alpha [Erysipelothrix larvae]AMC94161.1 oxaloacetate decarboxylase [Erysipelothrix larvae]